MKILRQTILWIVLLCMLHMTALTQSSSTSSGMYTLSYAIGVYSDATVDYGPKARSGIQSIYHDISVEHYLRPRWGIAVGLSYLNTNDTKWGGEAYGHSIFDIDVRVEKDFTLLDQHLHALSIPIYLYTDLRFGRGFSFTPKVGLAAQFSDLQCSYETQDAYTSYDVKYDNRHKGRLRYQKMLSLGLALRADIDKRLGDRISLGVSGIFGLPMLGPELRWTSESESAFQKVREMDEAIADRAIRDLQGRFGYTQNSVCINLKYVL